MKKLLVVLVLLLIAFAVVLTWGVARDDREQRTSEWTAVFGGVAESSPVTASRFARNPSCLPGREIRVATACALRLEEAEAYRPQELKLRLVEGGELRVELRTGGKAGLLTSLTLEAGRKPVAFPIPREGADLRLACTGPPPAGRPCRVALR